MSVGRTGRRATRLALRLLHIALLATLVSACTPASPPATPTPTPTARVPATPAPAPTSSPLPPTAVPTATRPATPAATAAPVVLLRVGLDAANRPWAYPDGKGGLTGLDAEVLAAVAGQSGMGMAYTNAAPHLLLPRLAEKQFDLVAAGLMATPELRRQAAVSLSYANVGQVVVVPAADTRTGGPADLAGKRVGAQLGSAALAEAHRIPGAVVVPYDDVSIALAALSRGGILEAVIADQLLAMDFLRAHPEARLRLAGAPFAVEPLVFAMRADDAALQARVNAALELLSRAGTLQQIQARWLQ